MSGKEQCRMNTQTSPLGPICRRGIPTSPHFLHHTTVSSPSRWHPAVDYDNNHGHASPSQVSPVRRSSLSSAATAEGASGQSLQGPQRLQLAFVAVDDDTVRRVRVAPRVKGEGDVRSTGKAHHNLTHAHVADGEGTRIRECAVQCSPGNRGSQPKGLRQGPVTQLPSHPVAQSPTSMSEDGR